MVKQFVPAAMKVIPKAHVGSATAVINDFPKLHVQPFVYNRMLRVCPIQRRGLEMKQGFRNKLVHLSLKATKNEHHYFATYR